MVLARIVHGCRPSQQRSCAAVARIGASFELFTGAEVLGRIRARHHSSPLVYFICSVISAFFASAQSQPTPTILLRIHTGANPRHATHCVESSVSAAVISCRSRSSCAIAARDVSFCGRKNDARPQRGGGGGRHELMFRAQSQPIDHVVAARNPAQAHMAEIWMREIGPGDKPSHSASINKSLPAT